MNIERLQYLADFLRTVPEDHFDLRTWRADNTKDHMAFQLVSNESLMQHACGTTGCAVGWACALPTFQEQGLVWAGRGPRYNCTRHLTSLTGWEAVQAFFDLDQEQGQTLFEASRYKSGYSTTIQPGTVANRIEAMIAGTYP